MYKVFVNEKKIVLSSAPVVGPKTLKYDGRHSFEYAVDLLTTTPSLGLNIYSDDLEKLWEEFKDSFKNIDAAGGIVKNSEGKILFIHRLGKWDLPKGKLEKGESKELAAVREVEEECGIFDLELRDYINPTYHIYLERDGTQVLKTTHWFEMFYPGNSQPKPQTEEGITQADWKDSEEIKNEILPSTFNNIKLILDDFENKKFVL